MVEAFQAHHLQPRTTTETQPKSNHNTTMAKTQPKSNHNKDLEAHQSNHKIMNHIHRNHKPQNHKMTNQRITKSQQRPKSQIKSHPTKSKHKTHKTTKITKSKQPTLDEKRRANLNQPSHTQSVSCPAWHWRWKPRSRNRSTTPLTRPWEK